MPFGKAFRGGGVDESDQLKEYLVQLARLAMTGRDQDVQAYVARLSRRLRSAMPQTSQLLGDLLRESPNQKSPLRGGAVAMMPVDTESRLNLAKVETTVILSAEPIWDAAVGRDLNELVGERVKVDDLIRAGLEATRTALFVGPPGVGKTLAARWIARSLGWPLIVLDLAAVMSSFLGRTGLNVRHVLDYAKSIQCVLLLDEIDAIAKRRDDQSEIGELKRLVTVLLQELDDWPNTALLVAATNHSDLLDPAVWRRFEKIVHFPMPSDAQIYAMIRDQFRGEPQAEDLFPLFLACLKNSSFSDIERVVLRIRRNQVLQSRALVDVATDVLADVIQSLSREARFAIGRQLQEAGVSQRRASGITGVARDTLRKATAALENGVVNA